MPRGLEIISRTPKSSKEISPEILPHPCPEWGFAKKQLSGYTAIMKFAITGATGFIGSNLISFLHRNRYDTVPIERKDFESLERLKEKLEQSDIVIHLAGAPIIARWTRRYMRELKDSRVQPTQKLVEMMKKARSRPSVLVSASAVGLYPDFHRQTESSYTVKHDFLASLCESWEAAVREAESVGIRTSIVRLGVVLGKNGGMIAKIRIPFHLGLGGRIAGGEQGVSWIHIEDICRLLLFIATKGGNGVYNAVSPNPVNNMQFTRVLSRTLHRPAFLPVPPFLLKLLFGKGARVLTSGQIVIPERAIQEGFSFHYPTLKSALADIFGK